MSSALKNGDLTLHIRQLPIDGQQASRGEVPVEIGMPVEMVTRCIRQDGDDIGILMYGYKFRPRLGV